MIVTVVSMSRGVTPAWLGSVRMRAAIDHRVAQLHGFDPAIASEAEKLPELLPESLFGLLRTYEGREAGPKRRRVERQIQEAVPLTLQVPRQANHVGDIGSFRGQPDFPDHIRFRENSSDSRRRKTFALSDPLHRVRPAHIEVEPADIADRDGNLRQLAVRRLVENVVWGEPKGTRLHGRKIRTSDKGPVGERRNR